MKKTLAAVLAFSLVAPALAFAQATPATPARPNAQAPAMAATPATPATPAKKDAAKPNEVRRGPTQAPAPAR
jgi:hypothetical protein